eukprot:m.107543 g.107543  ORF g.107543 m.107543 type:complete len:501 (+) comp37303_c0_seq7:28-1530(+)
MADIHWAGPWNHFKDEALTLVSRLLRENILWTWRLHPVLNRAVTGLSRLLGGELVNKLLEGGCIGGAQYDEIIRLHSRKQDRHAARRIFQIVKSKAEPSFSKFCEILLHVEGGVNLYNLLNPSDIKKEYGISRRQKSPRRDSTPTTASLGVKSDEDKKFVIIEVLESLEDDYKYQKSGIRIALKKYLRDISKKFELDDEIFQPELKKVKRPGQSFFAVGDSVKIRIIFPSSSCSHFEARHRQRITTHLAAIMTIKESEVEICVTEGSCKVTLTISGKAFIKFLSYIGRGGSLHFLYTVESPALIAFEDFPAVSIDMFVSYVNVTGVTDFMSTVLLQKATTFSQVCQKEKRASLFEKVDEVKDMLSQSRKTLQKSYYTLAVSTLMKKAVDEKVNKVDEKLLQLGRRMTVISEKNSHISAILGVMRKLAVYHKVELMVWHLIINLLALAAVHHSWKLVHAVFPGLITNFTSSTGMATGLQPPLSKMLTVSTSPPERAARNGV